MPFVPNIPFPLPPLPPQVQIEGKELQRELLSSARALAELKGRTATLPNPMLLLSPAILRESVASSEIENIHTTMAAVLQAQLFPESQQNETDKEVLNYNHAMHWGFEQLQEDWPLVSRLITGVHAKLLPSNNGEFKKQPNAIRNTRTGQVLYTPPLPTEVHGLIQNWEQFVNTSQHDIDPLIQVALAHYQFEAIHPFADGNGRVGRILMVLQLVHYQLITHPILYISGYINQTRNAYYEGLINVTREGAWYDFVLYIVRGMGEQARKTTDVLLQMQKLYEEQRDYLRMHHANIYSSDLVNLLFHYPVCSIEVASKALSVSYLTARKYLNELKKAYVSDMRHGKQILFVNKPLLSLFNQAG